MTHPYYADARKYFHIAKKPIIKSVTDKAANQVVGISGSITGTIIKPDRIWSPFCDKLFRKEGATSVALESIEAAPRRSLQFVADLPGCTSLAIRSGKAIDLSPLAGNTRLLDLQIYSEARCKQFDLSSLPNLQRCQVPLCPEVMSFLKCKGLTSLCLSGGRHSGTLSLEDLQTLEEFVCIKVLGLKSVVLHLQTRLRALELSNLRDLESITPVDSFAFELLVVELNRLPKMKIEWLRQAKKADCIALRLGKIPTINFLNGLKHLRVLDLFGSKVEDGNLAFRDSLKGELDSALWSKK